MALLRWSVVMVLGLAGGVSSPSTPAASAPPSQHASRQVEVEPKLEARVEIGPAVVYIYDEAGRVIATE